MVRMEQHDLQERAPLLELDDQWRRERPGPDGEEERTDVEVAAHVLLNAHGIIRRVAHEAQAARLGLVRELGTDRFARASQHDAGSERLVHTAQQQLVGQGDQVAREHQGGEQEPSGPSADSPMAEREAQKSGVTFSD